jgi:Tfp pilus assembly protein PilF
MICAELAFLYLEHGGDINAGIALAETARKRLPDSPLTADALGWAYYKGGFPEQAIASLREAVSRSPENSVFQYHLGKAYVLAGQPELAKGAFRAALSRDPSFPYTALARADLAALEKGSRGQ